MTKAHTAFQHLRTHDVPSLNIRIEEYTHRQTGAQHIHIHADNTENVFLVALRTVPNDSTGVAHILEHTALCGSEKYPVRDPFFMMIRRSLNTFMNAFTSSDWTAYPFASQNRKDFDNLLDVYLDAVFFSKLDELDFRQEGHRVEFADPKDANSELLFKGVVFNEMKGAMSSVPSTLWQTLSKHLHPNNTYHHNSGGEPERIPDLSYEELQSFYKKHYHPSNAIFMTFGDIPANDHQEKFEARALSQFEASPYAIEVNDVHRFNAPVKVEEAYCADSDEDKAHIVMGWLLGKSTCLRDLLDAQLLASVLYENSASPLQAMLETTKLGSAPSPLCGLEDSQKELIFVTGLEGCNTDDTKAVEDEILSAIQTVADEGVPAERLEACLHQLELSQREIGGDGFPYGLQLILTALNSATHRGDPITLLDLEPALTALRLDIEKPKFIEGLAQRLLLDNQHRVTLTMRPDTELAGRKQIAESDRLAQIKAALTEQETQHIIDQAEALNQRQNQADDPGLLPKVGLADVPKSMPEPVGETLTELPIPATYFNLGTNGIAYHQIIMPIVQLNKEELELLPYFAAIMTEVGVAGQDYLNTQNRQSSVCGSLSAFSSIRASQFDHQATSSWFVLSAKGLVNNAEQIAKLIEETLYSVRFDEHARIRELIAQIRARRESSLTGNGHSYAMGTAVSGYSGFARHQYNTSGLQGIRNLKALDSALNNADELAHFCDRLQQLHSKLISAPKQLLVIGDKPSEELTSGFAHWANSIEHTPSELSFERVSEQTNVAWITNSQVNFCAKAFPTVSSAHKDGAALTVLGGVMRNGFLHRAIREQGGAYGGGASQDHSTASFRFYSYRDPRNVDTLADFDRSIDWVLNTPISFEQVEESILGVISSLDKPASPAGQGKQAFHNILHNRSAEFRETFRERILSVTGEDLRSAAEAYLTSADHSTAVVSLKTEQATLEGLNLDIEVL